MKRRIAFIVLVVGCGLSGCGAAGDATTDDEVVLLAFGDSLANLDGWPAQLGALIQADQTTSVTVDGFSCFGGCNGLDRIRDHWTSRISAADVIVVQPQPGRVALPVFRGYLTDTCGLGLECMDTALADYSVYIRDLFGLVVDHARDDAVVLTIVAGTWGVDANRPDLRDEDPKAFDDLIRFMIEMGEMTTTAAEERCIGVVDVNVIMSGPNVFDPINPAYSDDRTHPNETGSAVIAPHVEGSAGVDRRHGGMRRIRRGSGADRAHFRW